MLVFLSSIIWRMFFIVSQVFENTKQREMQSVICFFPLPQNIWLQCVTTVSIGHTQTSPPQYFSLAFCEFTRHTRFSVGWPLWAEQERVWQNRHCTKIEIILLSSFPFFRRPTCRVVSFVLETYYFTHGSTLQSAINVSVLNFEINFHQSDRSWASTSTNKSGKNFFLSCSHILMWVRLNNDDGLHRNGRFPSPKRNSFSENVSWNSQEWNKGTSDEAKNYVSLCAYTSSGGEMSWRRISCCSTIRSGCFRTFPSRCAAQRSSVLHCIATRNCRKFKQQTISRLSSQFHHQPRWTAVSKVFPLRPKYCCTDTGPNCKGNCFTFSFKKKSFFLKSPGKPGWNHSLE